MHDPGSIPGILKKLLLSTNFISTLGLTFPPLAIKHQWAYTSLIKAAEA
jgi:hypothetical protein